MGESSERQVSKSTPPVHVDILHTPDCPAWRDARLAVERVAGEESIPVEIADQVVATLDQAQEMRFPGSPTVRVDGRDVESGAASGVAGGVASRAAAGAASGVAGGVAPPDYSLG